MSLSVQETLRTSQVQPERMRLLRILAQPNDRVLDVATRASGWNRLYTTAMTHAKELLASGKCDQSDIEMLILALWESVSTAEHLVCIQDGIIRLFQALQYDRYTIIRWDTMHRLVAFFQFYWPALGNFDYAPEQSDKRFSRSWLWNIEELKHALHYSQAPMKGYYAEKGHDHGYATILPTIARWHNDHMQYTNLGLIAASSPTTIEEAADGIYIRELLETTHLPDPREREARRAENYLTKDGQPRPTANDPQRAILRRDPTPDTIARLYVLMAAIGSELNWRSSQKDVAPLRYLSLSTEHLRLYYHGLHDTLTKCDVI